MNTTAPPGKKHGSHPVIGDNKLVRLVYIVGGYDRQYVKLFAEYGRNRPGSIVFRGTREISEADIVVFTGGADVDPQLYNERQLTKTFIDPKHDALDMEAWATAPQNALKVGICRGAQFLNVMCGGSLWQDVDGHRSGHVIVDRMTGNRVYATSTHHQMMRPGKGARLIAVANTANVKVADGRDWERNTDAGHISNVAFLDGDVIDPEVLAYDDERVLCFQPHPEHDDATASLRTYFFNQINVLELRTNGS